MGDHRADIKIQLRFPDGKKHGMDMWINYSPWTSDCDGLDQRVIDFFREAWNQWEAKYNDAIEKEDRKRNAKKIEAEERETLARLQEKYQKGE